jgi:hypothetical protein
MNPAGEHVTCYWYETAGLWFLLHRPEPEPRDDLLVLLFLEPV